MVQVLKKSVGRQNDNMKRKKLFFLIASLGMFLVAVFLFIRKAATGGFEKELVPSFTEPQSVWNDIHGPYILTRWKQDGAYAAFTPENELLGCWSVAFAQVLAFHRLSPSGNVQYITSDGKIINQNLHDSINWGEINNYFDSDSLSDLTWETARFCYQVATVLQKDFGTGEYKDISIVSHEVSEHYRCMVKKVDSDLIGAIESEIHLGRPVIAYFNDILAIKIVRNGHAVVVDGSAEDENNLYIHLNCGWGGDSDGWYEFRTLADQRKLLYIFTVVPL